MAVVIAYFLIAIFVIFSVILLIFMQKVENVSKIVHSHKSVSESEQITPQTLHEMSPEKFRELNYRTRMTPEEYRKLIEDKNEQRIRKMQKEMENAS